MTDEHQPQSQGGLEVLEEVEHLGAHRDVQGGGGLVGHDDVGVQGERSGDGDALALTTGDLPRQHVECAGGQPDQVEQVAHLGLTLLGRPDSVDVERVDERVVHDHARVEGRGRVLEDHRDAASQIATVRGRAPQGTTLEDDLTGGDRLQPHHDSGRGGLAATRLPHESQRLSALDAQRDVVDRVNRVRVEQATGAGLVDDIDIPELDDRLVLAP